jgi:hypothetical protein
MTVQGLIVAAIVSIAVWAIIQRVRGLLAPAARKGQSTSCHGCDECGDG